MIERFGNVRIFLSAFNF